MHLIFSVIRLVYNFVLISFVQTQYFFICKIPTWPRLIFIYNDIVHKVHRTNKQKIIIIIKEIKNAVTLYSIQPTLYNIVISSVVGFVYVCANAVLAWMAELTNW